MNSELNALIALYFSTSCSSIIMNSVLCEISHIKSKKESMRKLKYKKGLYYQTKIQLFNIEVDHIFDILESLGYSIIPFYNIFYTVEKIEFKDDYKKETLSDYDEIIEVANELEKYSRKRNVLMLKNLESELKVIPNNIDFNNNLELTKKETKNVLKLNNRNYNKELKKYEKEKNLC